MRHKSDNSVTLMYHLTHMHCEDEMYMLCFHHPRKRTISERMMDMMEWIKWKVIELLIEHRVLAVVPARVQKDRRFRH